MGWKIATRCTGTDMVISLRSTNRLDILLFNSPIELWYLLVFFFSKYKYYKKYTEGKQICRSD